MDGIKTKVRRIRYWFLHGFLSVENVVLVLAVILCLVLTYQSVAAMSRNWELSERLTAEKKQLELLTIEVETAELENQYLASDEYQELMARRNMDKKLEGENMVVMPENSEEAKSKHRQIAATKQERQYSNFEKWMMYLFPNY